MKRRDFIWVSSLSTLTFFFPLFSCHKNTDLDNILSLPITLSYIFDNAAIIEIGKKYLKKDTTFSTKKLIKKLLMKDIEISTTNSQSDFSLIIEQLMQKIKKDFETDRTIEIDGWILSETEAEQCALFSLINT